MAGSLEDMQTAGELLTAWMNDLRAGKRGEVDGDYFPAILRMYDTVPLAEEGDPSVAPILKAMIELAAVAVGRSAIGRGITVQEELSDILVGLNLHYGERET